jgi:hypothetical protein
MSGSTADALTCGKVSGIGKAFVCDEKYLGVQVSERTLMTNGSYAVDDCSLNDLEWRDLVTVVLDPERTPQEDVERKFRKVRDNNCHVNIG